MTPDQIAAMRGTSIANLVREQRLAERFEAEQAPFSQARMDELTKDARAETDDLLHAKLAIAFALGVAAAQEADHADD